MTTLILVRHGESAANEKNVFAGHTDVELSPLGKKQAERTAEYIAKNYTVDAIYSSDLKRAYDTGACAAKKLGLSITPDTALREIYAGEWENQKYDVLQTRYKADYDMWLTDIGKAVCTGGESVQELSTRIRTRLTEIAKEHDGKTVLVTTHATPIRVCQCVWEGRTPEEMRDVPWVKNASVTIAEYDGGVWTIKEAGQERHLAGIISELAPNV